MPCRFTCSRINQRCLDLSAGFDGDTKIVTGLGFEGTQQGAQASARCSAQGYWYYMSSGAPGYQTRSAFQSLHHQRDRGRE